MISTPRIRDVPPVASGYPVPIATFCGQGDRVLGSRPAQGYEPINGRAKIRI